MTRALIFVLGWCACAAPALPACLAVEGDRIQAQSLAAVLPAFLKIPGETLIANAPQPGSRRVLHGAELQAIARRFSIEAGALEDVCFEWAMQPLDRERVAAAMRASLASPGAVIEIVELSLYPAPPGRIEFPRDRLVAPSAASAPGLWRGDVIYGRESRRFAVWARVRIRMRSNRVVAAAPLRAGEPVAAQQLKIEAAEGFPPPATAAQALEQVVGRAPKRPIPAGAAILLDQLAVPNEVNRGDTVEIEVQSGAARLSFTALAVSAGHTGETIAVRNPESKRLFHARVSGKGKALVLAGVTQVN